MEAPSNKFQAQNKNKIPINKRGNVMIFGVCVLVIEVCLELGVWKLELRKISSQHCYVGAEL
jgi:hypothetical protein